jgi:hypothetical protein
LKTALEAITTSLHQRDGKPLKTLGFVVNGVQEAAGSNPVTRTKRNTGNPLKSTDFRYFFIPLEK